MTGLFPADPAAVLVHIFVYIFISYRSLRIADAKFIERFVESEV